MFQNFERAEAGADRSGRLAALRAHLAAAEVTGFLIPRADAHQGEYVAPRDERLSWLTGFTGSAGIAIVLAERAGVIVDGRYTLQAAQQVDTEAYEIVPSHETPAAEWLASVVGDGDVIGYDPWLHGKAEIDRVRAAVEEKGARLQSLSENPVDAIWEDQPPPPAGAARVHGVDLAGEESADKRARLGKTVAQAGATAAVLTLPDSLSWLLNIRGSDIVRTPIVQGFGILHGDGRCDLFVDPDKIDGEVAAHLGNQVTVHAGEALAEQIAMLDGPVLLDKTSCPLWFVEQFETSETDVVWGRDPCVAAKAPKNAAELAGTRAAHLRDGAAMIRFLHWFDTAMAAGETLTEIDVASRLEAFRAEDPTLQDISFDTIAGSGPNGAIVHYRVNRETNRTLVPGDLMLVDSGAQYPDGTTDITRTLATGPVTAEQRRHFTLVLKGMIAISVTRWPAGLRGRDLDALARSALWRAGLDYDHGTGHGVGVFLGVHEGPQNLSRRGEAVLEPGMILSNEPGYYVVGAYGIRIENLLIVTEPSVPEGGVRPMLGFETLTWCPIDRRLIDATLLTPDERAWMDAYHAEVLARLRGAVEDETRAWLQAACAAL